MLEFAHLHRRNPHRKRPEMTQFARSPIAHGSTRAELVEQRYELEDVVLTKDKIIWAVDDPDLEIRIPNTRRPRQLKWGGDAYNHLIKDMKLAEKDDDKEFLLRIRDNIVVGALTTEYAPVNNATIIDTLVAADLNVTKWRLSPSRSYFFATGDEQVRVGEETYAPGLAIINSESGYKRLQIHAGLLRLVCMNGAYVALPDSDEVFDRLHLVQSLGSDFDIREKLLTVYGSASNLVDQMEHTREFGDTAEHVEAWLTMEFGKRQRKQVLLNMGLDPEAHIEGDVPRFELLNGVTQLHTSFPKSSDRWAELGGKLFEETYLLDQLFPDEQQSGRPDQQPAEPQR